MISEFVVDLEIPVRKSTSLVLLVRLRWCGFIRLGCVLFNETVFYSLFGVELFVWMLCLFSFHAKSKKEKKTPKKIVKINHKDQQENKKLILHPNNIASIVTVGARVYISYLFHL